MWTAIWPLTMNIEKRIPQVEPGTISVNSGSFHATVMAFPGRGFCRWMLTSLFTFAAGFTASAQSDYSRVEFGGEFKVRASYQQWRLPDLPGSGDD